MGNLGKLMEMERAKPKQAGSLAARDCSYRQDLEATKYTSLLRDTYL
jgi:hypothetical protein